MKLSYWESLSGLEGPLQTASYVQYAVFCRTLRTTGGFAGYSEVTQGAWGNKFVPTPITERPVQFLHIKYFSAAEGCKVEGYKAVLKADHSMNITAEKVLDLVVEASKCSNQLEIYANALKTWLDNSTINADVYLADCANSKYYHITRNAATLQTGAAPSLANSTSFTADFAIKACWDGQKWTQIEHKFKPGALNPTHPKLQGQTAQIELLSNQRIEAKLKNEYPNKTSTGKATKRGTVDADGFRFDQLDMFEMIITVKNVTKELCNNAKVPEQLYDPANSGFTPSPVNVPAFAAGAGDGVLEEITGGLQFISFGLDLATEPAKAKQMYAKIKGIKVSDIVLMAQNSVSERISIYNQGGIKAQHQGGKDAVALAQIVTGVVTGVSKQTKELVENAAEGSVKSAKEILDDLGDIAKEIDYFSEKTREGILADLADKNLRDFVKKNPDIINSWYKYKSQYSDLTPEDLANNLAARRELEEAVSRGEIPSNVLGKVERWDKRADGIETRIKDLKKNTIEHENLVTQKYRALNFRVFKQVKVKFKYTGTDPKFNDFVNKDIISFVDDIVIEGSGSNIKFIWSDAKLGDGTFSKNQKMLMEMIKTENFEVNIVRSEGIDLGADGIRNQIVFSQINVVESASKNIAGEIIQKWPE